MQNLAGDQQKMIQAIAQHRLPQLANQRQLLAERNAAAPTAGARSSSSRLIGLGAGERNQRARAK